MSTRLRPALCTTLAEQVCGSPNAGPSPSRLGKNSAPTEGMDVTVCAVGTAASAETAAGAPTPAR